MGWGDGWGVTWCLEDGERLVDKMGFQGVVGLRRLKGIWMGRGAGMGRLRIGWSQGGLDMPLNGLGLY